MALLEIKSKLDAEFRRVSIKTDVTSGYDQLYLFLQKLHHLENTPFVIQYVDPKGSLLPITNDKNCALAYDGSRSLHILIQRKGESHGERYGYKSSKSRTYKDAGSILRSYGSDKRKPPERNISIKNDFHLVSSILDVHVVPSELRRVRLVRTPNKHFGLFIRDGVTHRSTLNGYETVPAFYISRLDEGGIAYGTGLLAKNDEIVEVNGIEVAGKTIDQVTDMMVANSSNLIITVRPADQRTCLSPSSSSRTRLSTSQSVAITLPRERSYSNYSSLSQQTGESYHHSWTNQSPGVGGHVNLALDDETDHDDGDEFAATGLISL